MKNGRMIWQALLCFVLVFSLTLPAAVAGASSATAQVTDEHVVVDLEMASSSPDSTICVPEDYATTRPAVEAATPDHPVIVRNASTREVTTQDVCPHEPGPEAGFDSIAEELVIAYHYAGLGVWHVYWPEFGIDTIEALEVGNIYIVYVDSHCTLEYDTQSYELSGPDWNFIYWRSGSPAPPNDSPTVPETTVVLGETALNCISWASENFSTLSFAHTTEQLSSLSVGDVIVSGASETTPYGLLREVTNVVFNGDQIVVETAPATLEDAIQDCTIDTNWRLQSDGSFVPLEMQDMATRHMLSTELGNASASSAETLGTGFYLHFNDLVLFDDDGFPDTKNDQIIADVSVRVNVDFNIGWTIGWFRLVEAHSQTTVSAASEIELSCKATVAEIHPKMEVYRQYLSPFTVMVGPVPVVILPMLSLNIGLHGEVSAGITAGVTENANLKAGVQYSNGDWSTITDFSASFDWQEPTLSAGCEVKLYAGPQLSFLLYGGAGPYTEVRGYLELDADIFKTPWWELYGGLEVDVGFKVEAMGHEIADYEKPLAIGYRKLLASAETPTLLSLTISSSAGGSVTAPGEGTFSYGEGTVISLVAAPANGYCFVNWTGDVGTIANVNAASTTITMNGDYSITATFEVIPLDQYNLTISSTAGGSVATPGEGTYTYDAGTVVGLVATPASGYQFVNWTGDVGTIANVNSASTTITMHADYSITASFVEYTAVVPAGGRLAGSVFQTVGVKSDGTVVAAGCNDYGRCDVDNWTHIIQVAAGRDHTVGLRSDGTMVAVGDNDDGQCDVGGWTDIVQVAAGYWHTMGLKFNGSVVAVGYNYYGQLDVGDWTDIIQVAAGRYHTLGLRSDGTLVAAGSNYDGQCDVGGWTNIIQVAAGNKHTVGLKSNGTVVVVGWYLPWYDVDGWTDIIQVAAGGYYVVGLKSDGTVVAVGKDYYGQCGVGGWTNVVQVSAGYEHTVGLKGDGTVVAVGRDDCGQCDVGSWMLN